MKSMLIGATHNDSGCSGNFLSGGVPVCVPIEKRSTYKMGGTQSKAFRVGCSH